MPGKLHIGSLPFKILQLLISEADDLLFIFSNPQAVFYTLGDVESARMMLIRKDQKMKHANQERVRQAMKRLEKRKLIKIRKDGEKIFFFLTHDGIKEALKQKIINQNRKLAGDTRCFVSFDIPKKVNSVRWALRELLKKADFKMIHQSLWSSNKDVGKELTELVKLLKADEWICVFEARMLTEQPKHKK